MDVRSSSQGAATIKRNKLLSALPDEEFHAIEPQLKKVPLVFRQSLYEPEQPIGEVYFPVSGVLSLVNEPESGEVVEFATVGREGMAGLPVLLGGDSMPSHTFVQVEGEAFRMEAKAFRKAVEENPAFHTTLMRYTLALLNQIAQSTSCNRLHEVQERCARWLLQTHDRVESDTFVLTQEFLSQMLGVHRPTVTVAAGMLAKAGLIDYTRGKITIMNRKGLEAASCSCYGLIVREYERLLNSK